jgi:hypothetical protein
LAFAGIWSFHWRKLEAKGQTRYLCARSDSRAGIYRSAYNTFEDLSNPATSRNDAYLMQGVTTVATGNDGSSPLQIADALQKWAQQGIDSNAALFIGQGTVRCLGAWIIKSVLLQSRSGLERCLSRIS